MKTTMRVAFENAKVKRWHENDRLVRQIMRVMERGAGIRQRRRQG